MSVGAAALDLFVPRSPHRRRITLQLLVEPFDHRSAAASGDRSVYQGILSAITPGERTQSKIAAAVGRKINAAALSAGRAVVTRVTGTKGATSAGQRHPHVTPRTGSHGGDRRSPGWSS